MISMNLTVQDARIAERLFIYELMVSFVNNLRL